MCKALSVLLLTTLLALCIAEAPQWQNTGDKGELHTILRTWHRRPQVNVGNQKPRQDQPCHGHPMAGYPAAGLRPATVFVLPTETDYKPALEYGPPHIPMGTYGVPSISSYEAPAQNGANYEEEAKMTFKRDLSVDSENEDVQKSAEENVTEETLQQQESFNSDNDDGDVSVNNDNAQLQQAEGIQQEQEEAHEQQIEAFEIPLAYLQIPVQFVPVNRKQ